MKTYYDILEISRFASNEVLERAHKVLIKKYHPDLETDLKKKKEKEEYIKKINDAYETLSDEKKRREYDTKVFGTTDSNVEKNENKSENKEEKIVDNKVADQFQEKRANEVYIEKINEEIKKAQERIDEEEKVIKENLKYYERQYLKSLGYTIYEPTDWKRVGITILVIIILLILAWLIYLIPPVKNAIENEINNNTSVGIVLKLIKGIYIGLGSILKSIFKK